MNEKPLVIFSYLLDDILEEVTKRTSYLGKMRGTEQEPLVLDRLSLTHGENFMFTEFIEDAATNVYDWLVAFGRNINHAFHAKCVYDETIQYKDYGVTISIENEEAEAGRKYKYENLTAEVIQGLESSAIAITAPAISMESLIESVGVEVTYTFLVHTLLDGTLKTVETKVKTINRTLSKGEVFTWANALGGNNVLTIPFDFNESGSVHTLQNVDVEIAIKVTPTNIQSINAEAYVEYHPNLNDLSVVNYYQIVNACTNAEWKRNADELPIDPRGKIVFILEQVDNFDINLVHPIDRDIKEALVNYIIYRWFEFVNPTEHEYFYEKFESYARKAKNGMDGRTSPIQRKYNIHK